MQYPYHAPGSAQEAAVPASALLRAAALYVGRLRAVAANGVRMHAEHPHAGSNEQGAFHAAQLLAYTLVERVLLRLSSHANVEFHRAADALHDDVQRTGLVEATPNPHPQLGWTVDDLADADRITEKLQKDALAMLHVAHDRHRPDWTPEHDRSSHGALPGDDSRSTREGR